VCCAAGVASVVIGCLAAFRRLSFFIRVRKQKRHQMGPISIDLQKFQQIKETKGNEEQYYIKRA
jgi:hypothetical protein